jgi:hypothetical protein
MRDRPRPQYLLDRGNAASVAQARIDDHQVRLIAGRGAFLVLCVADIEK